MLLKRVKGGRRASFDECVPVNESRMVELKYIGPYSPNCGLNHCVNLAMIDSDLHLLTLCPVNMTGDAKSLRMDS